MSTLLNIVFQTPHEINQITGHHIRGLQPFKHTPVTILKNLIRFLIFWLATFNRTCTGWEPMQMENVK